MSGHRSCVCNNTQHTTNSVAILAQAILAQVAALREGADQSLPPSRLSLVGEDRPPDVSSMMERITRLERVVEQILGMPVPQIKKGIVEVTQHVPQEPVPNPIVEQIGGVPLSQTIQLERIQERIEDPTFSSVVPQITEKTVEVNGISH